MSDTAAPKSVRKIVTALPTHVKNRSFLEVWEDYLYGYDFFVCYRWSDARDYAVKLTTELQRDYSVFLDTAEYAAGDSLSQDGNRAIRKTTRLLFIATAGVAGSEHIARELRVFRETGRRFVAINVNGSLERLLSSNRDLQAMTPQDKLHLSEPLSALSEGPSPEVVKAIKDSFSLELKRTKRKKAIAAACFMLLSLASIAVGAGFLANDFYQYKKAEGVLVNEFGAKVSPSSPASVVIDNGESATRPRLDVQRVVNCCLLVADVNRLEILGQEVQGVSAIGELEHLRLLNLYNSRGIDSLRFIGRLKQLDVLYLNDVGLTDRELTTLQTGGALKELILSNNSISNLEIARLMRENQSLQSLRLYHCKNLILGLSLAKEIREHARQLKTSGYVFTLEVDQVAVESSDDPMKIREIFEGLRTDGHVVDDGSGGGVPFNHSGGV